MNGAWKVARRTIVLDANVLLDKTSASSFYGFPQGLPDGLTMHHLDHDPSVRPSTRSHP
jgi:hypothetical protein